MTLTLTKPASDKQKSFIAKLLTERVVDDEHAEWLTTLIEADALGSFLASEEIGSLLSKPKKVAEPVAKKVYVEAVPGFYKDPQGQVFEVVLSKQGNKYAKALMIKATGKTCGGCEACDGEDACKTYKGKWEFIPGAMKNFQTWEKVDLAVAEAFGKKYGVCCICGRSLTNEQSVEAGIGPICKNKVW